MSTTIEDAPPAPARRTRGAASAVRAGARTTAMWTRLTAMFPRERERGVYDVDPRRPADRVDEGYATLFAVDQVIKVVLVQVLIRQAL